MFRKILHQIVFYGLLAAAWKLLFSLKIWSPSLFPSPGQVLETLREGFTNRTFFIAIGVSMRRLVIGYSLAVVFGTAFGVLIGKVRVLDETAGGFLMGLQTLPSVCWLPVSMLLFGINETAVISVVVMGSFLSIIMATDSGIKNIEPLYLKVGRSMGAQGVEMFRHVVLPAAMPAILIGLKQGWLFAWRSLMAGEILFVSLGLGHLLNQGRDMHDMSQVIAVMILIVLIGVLIDALVFGLLERKVRKVWGLEGR